MFQKIEKVINWLEEQICVVVLIVMVIDVTLMVLTRYLLKVPFAFVEELGRVCLIYMTFIGGGIVTRKKGNFALEILVHRLPLRFRNSLELVILFLVAGLLGVITYNGVAILPVVYPQESSSLRFSMSYVYVAIPVGAFFMFFHTVGFIVDRFKEDNEITQGAHQPELVK
jgi:TRAP-type transport system small permease protein